MPNKKQPKPKCINCIYRNPTPTFSGDKYACHKTGYNVRLDQECVCRFSFNFPEYKTTPKKGDWDDRQKQVEYTIGELEEALAAIEKRDESNYLEEVMDAHHSNETSLREFSQETLGEAAEKVRDKNAKRGYYLWDMA